MILIEKDGQAGKFAKITCRKHVLVADSQNLHETKLKWSTVGQIDLRLVVASDELEGVLQATSEQLNMTF